MIIVVAIVFLIVIGLLLAGFIAPILMVANKKKLKLMDSKIAEFEALKFGSLEEREKAKHQLKKELVEIKAGINQADKQSVSIAADKISIL